MDEKKALLYSTGNYIQYPVINHNGKEYLKHCLYAYNWVNLLQTKWHIIVNQLYFKKFKKIRKNNIDYYGLNCVLPHFMPEP